MKLVELVTGIFFLGVALMQTGAQQQSDKAVVRLWPDNAPGAFGQEDTDIPTITPWLVESATTKSAAMVICPGGGYHSLMPYEGELYARWLNQMGISAFVLKYRLGSSGYRYPAMLNDAARAVRTVRARADEWKLDPNRVGIIGSSAGGHLVSMLMTDFDAGDANSTDTIEQQSSRPDLGIMCYAVVNMTEMAHMGVQGFLLGENPPEDLQRRVSTEQHVTAETPPAFIWHTAEDDVAPVEHSLIFATALAEHDVPFALHIYPHGRHGLGLGTREWSPEDFHPWTTQCKLWLRELGFLP